MLHCQRATKPPSLSKGDKAAFAAVATAECVVLVAGCWLTSYVRQDVGITGSQHGKCLSLICTGLLNGQAPTHRPTNGQWSCTCRKCAPLPAAPVLAYLKWVQFDVIVVNNHTCPSASLPPFHAALPALAPPLCQPPA